MAQRPRPLHPHLSTGHLFGAQLRELRVRRGLSQAALGQQVHVSGASIGKIEKAARRASEDLVLRLDAALDGGDYLVRLWSAVDAEARRTSPPNGVAEREVVMSRIPALRRVLDTYDLPADGPIVDLPSLRHATERIVTMRLSSQYVGLSTELPQVLSAALRAFHCGAGAGAERMECARLLVQVLRAADAVADKFGLYDLSARIIGLIQWAADESGDEATVASAAYVRGEVFFASGDWEAGRRLLERASDTVARTPGRRATAAYGALHMRAAVLAARAGNRDRANGHIAEATAAAVRIPEAVYTGTAFGPSSVRIHRVSLALDNDEPGDALNAAAGWTPPLELPAERRSHFFVDVANAQLRCGRPREAVDALQTARLIAPQHVRYHPQVRAGLLTLMQRSERPSASLRDLVRWTGLAGDVSV